MTTIKSTQTTNSTDNIVLIGNAKSDFSKYGLSPAELSFVSKQVKVEEHSININQYTRRILIYIGEDKGGENATLEAFRKAGSKACGIFNAAKVEQVTLVDLNRNAAQILAFTEGMALGNYQFLQFKKDSKKLAHSLKSILIHSKKVSDKEIEHLQIVVDATEQARTLVNEPVNHLNAVQLQKSLRKWEKRQDLK